LSSSDQRNLRKKEGKKGQNHTCLTEYDRGRKRRGKKNACANLPKKGKKKKNRIPCEIQSYIRGGVGRKKKRGEGIVPSFIHGRRGEIYNREERGGKKRWSRGLCCDGGETKGRKRGNEAIFGSMRRGRREGGKRKWEGLAGLRYWRGRGRSLVFGPQAVLGEKKNADWCNPVAGGGDGRKKSISSASAGEHPPGNRWEGEPARPKQVVLEN